MRKRLALATIAATAGLAAIGGLAGSAGAAATDTAAPITGYVKGYASSYTGPSDTAMVVHHLRPDMEVDTYCFRNSQVKDGNAVWFAINHDGKTGYIHASDLSVPGAVPHC